MCLLIVIAGLVPEWPLIVAANRDERYDRPAQSLTFLRSAPPRVLGGRDLLAGGTWLAVNERGVVAGLTNKPAPDGRDPAKRSRGEIPLALTTATDSAAASAAAFGSSVAPGDYNPCWVLVGDRTSLFYLDMTQSDRVRALELPPGIHVLENKPMGAPSTKVEHVRRALSAGATDSGDEVMALLQGLLQDHAITLPAADDAEATQRATQLSACCVHTEGYGTRSSMLVRVPRSAHASPEVWASDGPSCTNPLTPAAFGECPG